MIEDGKAGFGRETWLTCGKSHLNYCVEVTMNQTQSDMMETAIFL
jgi:hypothetical protein